MRTNPWARGAATALVAALLLGSAVATAGAEPAGSRPTREFVQATASSDQFEIRAAETALAQSRSAEVRAFAARLLDDHRKTSRALADAAVRSGLAPPEMAMGADQAQLLSALQSVGSDEFDSLYLRQQLLAHRSALVVEQMYATSGDDANLRQSANAAVPIVSAHLDMASRVAAQLGVR